MGYMDSTQHPLPDCWLANPNCDGAHCRKAKGPVRKLPTGGGSNAILCQDCFNHEMQYRRERNRTLDIENRFSIPLWHNLPLYGGDDDNAT